eukprot:15480229-Alexandrium_andersonii.AAC.1
MAQAPRCHEPESPLGLEGFWQLPRLPATALMPPTADASRQAQRVQGLRLLNWGPLGVGTRLTARQLAASTTNRTDRLSLACFDADAQVTPALVQLPMKTYRLPPHLWAAAREAATDVVIKHVLGEPSEENICIPIKHHGPNESRRREESVAGCAAR